MARRLCRSGNRWPSVAHKCALCLQSQSFAAFQVVRERHSVSRQQNERPDQVCRELGKACDDRRSDSADERCRVTCPDSPAQETTCLCARRDDAEFRMFPPHCVAGSGEEEIIDELADLAAAARRVVKRRYSAFFGTDFEILLKGLKVDTLFLCGGLTDVCVHYTFVDAHQHDYHAHVVEDCVGGSSFEAHNASLKAMEYLQHGARCSSGDVIAAFRERQREAA